MLYVNNKGDRSPDRPKEICVKLKLKEISVKFKLSSSSIFRYILGAQKDRLTEMILLSTHNICFG